MKSFKMSKELAQFLLLQGSQRAGKVIKGQVMQQSAKKEQENASSASS